MLVPASGCTRTPLSSFQFLISIKFVAVAKVPCKIQEGGVENDCLATPKHLSRASMNKLQKRREPA